MKSSCWFEKRIDMSMRQDKTFLLILKQTEFLTNSRVPDKERIERIRFENPVFQHVPDASMFDLEDNVGGGAHGKRSGST